MKSEIPEIEDSLESKLLRLADINSELRKRKKDYLESIKHLRESKKSLEFMITEEVKSLKKTVTVGNIRAMYVPTVEFKMWKEKDNDGK